MPGAGRATALVVLLAALTGCADPVEVDAPSPSTLEAEQCAALLAALPDVVSGQERREVDPPGAPAAAWGDPAIVLVCGGEMPADFDGFSSCQEADGVGWYIPEDLLDPADDVVMTTIGWRPVVEVRLPARHRPPAAAMVDLAGAIKTTLTLEQPCI